MADQSEELRERPVGELLKQLSEETSNLVKQELTLARAELEQQGRRAGVGAGMLGGAGVAGLLTLGSLTAMLVALLDTAMATWLAALILTVVWGAVAGVLALQGRNKITEATPPAPQTVETVKEDVRWAKTRT
ncbi:MAG TPA: phage holin family protein [Baekduia sp.]|uniref:phage holin family protein n=1 Tax=Baekduia sp. TaxID=2600305 RepID=UPI002C99A286|nr:phage holin family protein [Baekduia sp.]HMJ34228.1 phage holin family protein [Baekduia sp.]